MQYFISRISPVRKFILHFCFIRKKFAVEVAQLPGIYFTCLIIMCGKNNIAILFAAAEGGLKPAFQYFHSFFIQFIIANLVQQANKLFVALPVNFIEFNINRRFFLQYFAVKKILAVIIFR